MPDRAIDYDSIEIDKSSDGRYWYVLYWPDDLVLLRLRIQHTCPEDGDDYVAEVKVRKPNDGGGRSESGFSAVGEFDLSPWEIEPHLDELPRTRRKEFVAMLKHWAQHQDVGRFSAALGTLKPHIEGNTPCVAENTILSK